MAFRWRISLNRKAAISCAACLQVSLELESLDLRPLLWKSEVGIGESYPACHSLATDHLPSFGWHSLSFNFWSSCMFSERYCTPFIPSKSMKSNQVIRVLLRRSSCSFPRPQSPNRVRYLNFWRVALFVFLCWDDSNLPILRVYLTQCLILKLQIWQKKPQPLMSKWEEMTMS